MPQVRDAQGRFASMNDGLANLVSGAGTSADRRTHAFFTQPYVLPEQVEASYRSNWMMRKGIDLPPFDMTRGGRDWQLDEADVDKVEKEEKRLQLWAKLQQALILGRLGGGLIIMGVGATNPATPLGTTAAGPGSLRFLHVMNRWQVSLGPIVMDPTDDLFGQPGYFRMTFGKQGAGQVDIHPSRVIAFRGKLRPNLRGSTGDDWFWGDPLLVTVDDAVKNATNAMNGFASLIDEAKVDTITIPGLIELLATSDGEALVMKRINVANAMKSQHNTRILGAPKSKDQAGETWETRQIAWTGMPDMIRTYCAAVAGAFDIPATRFLGKSPDGMNATGSGDEANYIAKIRADQDALLRPALDQIDAVLLPSAGVTVTAEANYEFPPLQEMSELDKATTFQNRMTGIVALQGTGAIPPVAFDKAMQHTAVEEGWLAGLDGALAEIPEGERFPSESAPELDANGQPIDPSALQSKGGDPVLAGAGADGSAPRLRLVAKDAWMLQDWAPKTLYVRRDVLNRADIVKWAGEQGFTDIVPDLHVTITYSTTPVDWMTMGASWQGKLEIEAGGPRLVEALGPDGKYKALLFTAYELISRNQDMRDKGASFSWPEYQPHISIQIGGDIDLANVKPYGGKIVLGPEIFEEIRSGDGT